MFPNNDMLNRFRQSGAFLLVTVVFLLVAGGAMLYAMANLSTVSSATSSVAHNGNMALAAAQSGLKYCLLQPTVDCTSSDLLIKDLSTPAPAPCKIKVADGCFGAAPGICTITSTACCPNSSPSDPYRGAKKLSIQVQKTAGGYQIIPASRQAIVPDACPLL